MALKINHCSNYPPPAITVCLSDDNNNMSLGQECSPYTSMFFWLDVKNTQKCKHPIAVLTHEAHQPFLTLPQASNILRTHAPSATFFCLPCPPTRFTETPACPGCSPGSLAPPCWMEEAINRLSKSDLLQLFFSFCDFQHLAKVLILLEVSQIVSHNGYKLYCILFRLYGINLHNVVHNCRLTKNGLHSYSLHTSIQSDWFENICENTFLRLTKFPVTAAVISTPPW